MKLTWTDNSSDETGFKIYWAVNCNSLGALTNVGANVTTFTDIYGTPSCYKVCAYNVAGESCSDTASGAPLTKPAAPSNLAAASICGGIGLTWTDNSDNEDGFVLERAFPLNIGWIYSEFETVGSNITSYQHTGLSAGTEYSYRI